MAILLMTYGWKIPSVVSSYRPVENELIRSIPAALSIGMGQYITRDVPRSFHGNLLHKRIVEEHIPVGYERGAEPRRHERVNVRVRDQQNLSLTTGLLHISARIAIANRCSQTTGCGLWLPNAI
jgi:hypothetical protein